LAIALLAVCEWVGPDAEREEHRDSTGELVADAIRRLNRRGRNDLYLYARPDAAGPVTRVDVGFGPYQNRSGELTMSWFSLVGGAPRSPARWNWDELTSMPTPTEFFEQLFAVLCGVSELPSHVTERRVIPREERVASGFCGSKEVGYRWVERECLETSAVPYHVVVETYGLPGMELHWHYCFDYAGQAGHAALSHVSLKARFESPDAERRFTQVWRSVFNTVPVWEATAGP
jgi:hypothetical protein